MKRIMCISIAGAVLVSLLPNLVLISEAQTVTNRARWENPWTSTTFNPDGRINSTFYPFPKVLWDGASWVDSILNQSDMSGGIGSIYIRVRPDYTIILDPRQKEERIKNERWTIERYNSTIYDWEADYALTNAVSYSSNSSGILFQRNTKLQSGSELSVKYMLMIGSKLKISVAFIPSLQGDYRFMWQLDGICGTTIRLLSRTENISPATINNEACSRIEFIAHDSLKSSIDWSDTYFLNKTSGAMDTYFQSAELTPDATNSSKLNILFGDFALSEGDV